MNVLVTIPMKENHRKQLEKMNPDASYQYVTRQEETREQVQKANVIIGNVCPENIAGSKNLKWLQLDSAGTDGYCSGALNKEAILTNATGAYGLAISEHMIGTILMLQKKLNLYLRNQLNHVWNNEGDVTSIYNSTTLVIGLGNIGSEFAKRMKLLGSHVIGVKRRKSDIPECVDELYYEDQVDELLPRADIVALTMPAYGGTIGFMTGDRFSKMKKTSIFLNVGRGTLVDTEAMYQALKNRDIAGAAVDVIDPEPLNGEHPLWDLENFILTPHISGKYSLPETLERIVQISISNYELFLKKMPLKNTIDFTTGYKK